MNPSRVAPVPGGLLPVAAILFLAGAAHAATVRVADDGALADALAKAKPGTTILVASGTYRGGLFAAGLNGTEKAPIVIAGADRERPPVIEGGTSGLHVAGAAHLEIRDLVFRKATGNGINVDDAGAIDRPSRHVVLRRLAVRDVGPRGNCDGIKLSGVEDFLVADCVVERWGSGGSGVDMVGCHRGAIEDALFRHEGEGGASGVQAKGGSREVAIRRCRFENVGQRGVNLGGSTAKGYFRPRDPGWEAKDLTVEDCTFVGGVAAVAFVGVDGAVVRRNEIRGPGKWVARILQESRKPEFMACRNGRFERNLVVFRTADVRAAVNVGPGTVPASFVFAENWWFAEDRPEASRPALPVEERDGVYGKDPERTATAGYGPKAR